MTTAAPSRTAQLTLPAVVSTPLAEAIGFAAVALLVYWVTGPEVRGDMWPPLAEAFLDGRLHLVEDRPWLELVPRFEGGQYVPLPPVPAVTLLPVAAVAEPLSWADEIPGNVYASLFGALNVGLAYWLLLGWSVAESPRRWLTAGFAFTTHWWVAGMAGPHHYAEVVACCFLLLALNLAVRRAWPFLAGLAMGLAAGARVPTGLALPALLALFGSADARLRAWRPNRAHLLVLAGLALPALAVAWYNLARFGSPVDFGYAHIPHGDEGLLITDEPWFSEGLMSVSYIPRHLNVMFLAFFDVVPQAPYLRPSASGLSLLLTAPFLFWAVLARGRLALVLWASVLLVLIPDLMWGSWGFAQFGYRRILDVVPLLLLLLGMVFREQIGLAARATVLVGIAVHAYGIFVWNVLGFVG